MVMGTAQYIALEQALGQDAIATSDVYSWESLRSTFGQTSFTGDGALTVAMKHISRRPRRCPSTCRPRP